jgi:hypothetical protein
MRRKASACLAIGLAVAAMAPSATATEPTSASPAAPSAAAVANAQAERAALGLPSDALTVTALLGSTRDVGTSAWGISMSAEEEAAVDLPGRGEFAQDVEANAIPYAQSLPGFGGVYFDAASNGELVVILKGPDVVGQAGIAARMPAVSRGLRFVYRTLTDKDLKASVRRTETQWDAVLPGIRLMRASTDLPGGGIVVDVPAADLKVAQKATVALTDALGAPVTVRAASTEAVDTACTDRDHCVTPTKAGIRLYKGAIDTYNECTLGWMVDYFTDGQFVTSGHCGYGGSNSWLHPGISGSHVLGTEQATAYHNNGHDVMRVSLNDGQLGTGIYAESRPTSVEGYGYTGLVVYDSRGHANLIDGGTVASDYVRWYSNTGGYYVYGGSTNGIAQIGGDSGSPLYERYTSTMAAAIGIVDTADGNFTQVADIDSEFSVFIYTGG